MPSRALRGKRNARLWRPGGALVFRALAAGTLEQENYFFFSEPPGRDLFASAPRPPWNIGALREAPRLGPCLEPPRARLRTPCGSGAPASLTFA